jgi:hypothetical protein
MMGLGMSGGRERGWLGARLDGLGAWTMEDGLDLDNQRVETEAIKFVLKQMDIDRLIYDSRVSTVWMEEGDC